jgi:hypothetical protein
VEPLEPRSLLSASLGPWLSLSGPNDPADTLDAAAALGSLTAESSVRVEAAIGDSPAGAADVDWYAFTLDRPQTVTLSAASDAGVPSPVLSLYVRDPFDPADPATLLGVRQLAQAGDAGGGTLLTRALAAGAYDLAVSGAGNFYFNPFVADSGYDGQTGSYRLQLAAADLGLGPGDGPAVLASDPAAGSTLDRSPTMFRLDLSAAIDPTTVLPGDDVSLTYNPAGTFGDGHDRDVPLGTSHFSDAATELQLTPAAPLATGYYRLWLAGDTGANADVVTDADGNPLGAGALHPAGQDFTLTFHVAGVEGNTAPGARADDTPAGAHDLGDVSDGRLVQAAGAIGDDPTDPVPFDPSDVDLYHFRVSGPGRYAFAAEVFAQRIGSPLNAAASLFVLDPADGRLHAVTGDDDTLNPTVATDHRSLPLFADPAVFAGLTAGDYYLAVSGRKNVVDPNLGLLPGAGGIFDPDVSHSGSAGRSTGDYVLNLRVASDNTPPQVVAVTPAPGGSLDGPPAQVTVQFDRPVNLQELAFRAYQRTQQAGIASVYVQGADDVKYYPRLQSYDPATGQATFLMLDRLPVGDNALHLSGPLGLADFAGNPLVGNDPSGDYVAHFTVAGTGAPPHTDQGPQDLGILFPNELKNPGVTVTGTGADSYRFQVLQTQAYFFVLGGASRPAGVRLTLTDASGAAVATKPEADGVSLQAFLKPGVYRVQVSGWSPADGAYALKLLLGGSSENPQPLTVGPAPVLRLTLAPAPPAAAPTPAPAAEAPPATAPTPGTGGTAAAGTPTGPNVQGTTPGVGGTPAQAPPATAPAPATGGTVAGGTPTAPNVPVVSLRLFLTQGQDQPAQPSAGVAISFAVGTTTQGPVAAPRVGVPTTAVEMAFGQLAVLGPGPVGGASTGAVGDRARAPQLFLGVPDSTSARDSTRLMPEIRGRSANAVPGAQEPLAAAQDAAARERTAIRPAVAEAVHVSGLWRWLEMFNEILVSGWEEEGLSVPAEVLPQQDDQADVDTTPAADEEPDAAMCLVALAGLTVGALRTEGRARTPDAALRTQSAASARRRTGGLP